LGRRTKNNPCLIGEPGVGKTAIAEGLAQRIANGDVPETIEGKKVTSMIDKRFFKTYRFILFFFSFLINLLIGCYSGYNFGYGSPGGWYKISWRVRRKAKEIDGGNKTK
jgi:hypothetical protein